MRRIQTKESGLVIDLDGVLHNISPHEDCIMDQDGGPMDDHILRDEKNKNIYMYIRKVIKIGGKRNGQKRQGTRLYNTMYPYVCCGKLLAHIKVHMKVKDKEQGEARDILESTDKGVLEIGEGEVLIERRIRDKLVSDDYGPSPTCHE